MAKVQWENSSGKTPRQKYQRENSIRTLPLGRFQKKLPKERRPMGDSTGRIPRESSMRSIGKNPGSIANPLDCRARMTRSSTASYFSISVGRIPTAASCEATCLGSNDASFPSSDLDQDAPCVGRKSETRTNTLSAHSCSWPNAECNIAAKRLPSAPRIQSGFQLLRASFHGKSKVNHSRKLSALGCLNGCASLSLEDQ